MNKKAVIFDLDGTLLNTLEDLTDSTNFALSQFNFPQRTLDEVKQFVGNGVSKLIERAIPNGTDNPNFKNCLTLFKEHYKDNMFNKTKPYYGIITVLEKIKKSGIKTAVISNKFDDAVKELCKKYFEGLIDFSTGENEQNGIRKKPFPDMIKNFLSQYKLKNNDVIYAGDSEVDIQTAKNSGIYCITVLWGFKDKKFLQKNGAKNFVSKPDEILKYL